MFGDPSVPSQGELATGSIALARPPLTQAASGQPITLAGQRAIEVRFWNMSIQNDVGQPVYDGPADYQPGLPALKQMTLFDMSEGVVGWYLGFDGTGCVSMVPVGRAVTVRIAHK